MRPDNALDSSQKYYYWWTPLTILILLCGPEKTLASRMQTLKLCLGKSSTQRTIASWASFETWWLAVTKIAGAVEEFCKKKSKQKVHNILITKFELRNGEVKKQESEKV